MFAPNRLAARLVALAATALLLVSCGGSENDTPAAPPLFSTTVVLGSSLADTGNRCGLANDPDPVCFPVPPYAGRSTAANGLLFNQILAARYGGTLVASRAGGFNYAYGGARTGVIPTDTATHAVPNLQVQTEQFLQRVSFQANPQYLYIVDGAGLFANNVRRVFDLIGATPTLVTTLPMQAVTQAASDIALAITRLHAAGARHVLLTNTGDLGAVPMIAAGGAQAVELARGMGAGFNGALATQVVPLLRASLPDVKIYLADIAALNSEIVASPASFGLTNLQAPCYPFFSAPAAPICATPDAYRWWDELHPSAAMHALIAQRAAAAIGR